MLLKKKINKAKKGNKKAFQELIEEEKHKLYRMAYLYVKNEHDALDVVQETIMKAYSSINNLKEENYFSTWLTRILINTALDFIGKHNRVTYVDEFNQMESDDQGSIEEHMDLVQAIQKLGEPYRTVIILRYYQDFSIKEIAKTMDCPEGTVKTHIHRAIKLLKNDLRKEHTCNE